MTKMNFECKVIDDFIPLSYQEHIKNTLMSKGFPWYFSRDVTFGDQALDKQASPAFSHSYRINYVTNSEHYNFIAPLAHIGASIAGYPYKDVLQCRSFLQLPISKEVYKSIDPLHVDTDTDHLVVLYYVVDSDGDTVIVDKKMEGNNRELHLEAKDYKELWRVTPKQGRAVLFNGRYYHTAEQPKYFSRCVINLNVV